MSNILSAWEVYDDMVGALSWLDHEDIGDEGDVIYPNFKGLWILNVTLLRTIGHVLDKVDKKKNPILGKIIDDKYQEWKADKDKNVIYWDFICEERNSILKEYEIGIVFRYENDRWEVYYKDDYENNALDYIHAAERWWKQQLKEIENTYDSEKSKSRYRSSPAE
jgi:hypothetical protein